MAAELVILIYDIPDDNKRHKVSEACLDYGLDRIQFSAFQGRLGRGQQKELMARIRGVLQRSSGHIQLIPIGVQEWEKRLEILQEPADA